MRRVSIAKLLGMVGVVAVGLVAVSRASTLWLGLAFHLMIASLFAGLLGLILRRGRRGIWVGFVLFGWGYFLLGYLPDVGENVETLAIALSDPLYNAVNHEPPQPPLTPGAPGFPPTVDMNSPAGQAYQTALSEHYVGYRRSNQIARWLLVLAFAGLGAFLGDRFSRPIAPVVPTPNPTDPPTPDR